MSDRPEPPEYEGTELLRLRIDAGLYRAFQRCTWILVQETGRERMAIMEEMVRDFLIKHGC
ncbi:MAG: hypothetical protein M0017_00345 [Desulfobacteraceae bacterium]|nr:hypothetical protein [Desulfobacteraceae bacterium]